MNQNNQIVKSEEGLSEPRVVINSEECKSCGLCIEACPKKVIEISKGVFNSRGYQPAKYKKVGCTGCGNCFYACPEPGAITVYKKGYIGEINEY